MYKAYRRGFVLLESTFGIAMLGVVIASIALAIPRISSALESVENENISAQQMAKQRLDSQLFAYLKFANTI
ncbi:MAG: hypothetical protein COA51_02055 [Idiomarina sp.]|uniref:Uncharacterized protein n=1 Tax=Pseudidiomarina marina TaxID=502366 RepID=A0A432YKS4_9GAMM|nr:MAG: hypothetical protein COA51_02055 [Idiomarina sp.]RUO61574.1 hypothetical protein CWI76_04840 [Pseudidiomarina marina]